MSDGELVAAWDAGEELQGVSIHPIENKSSTWFYEPHPISGSTDAQLRANICSEEDESENAHALPPDDIDSNWPSDQAWPGQVLWLFQTTRDRLHRHIPDPEGPGTQRDGNPIWSKEQNAPCNCCHQENADIFCDAWQRGKVSCATCKRKGAANRKWLTCPVCNLQHHSSCAGIKDKSPKDWRCCAF